MPAYIRKAIPGVLVVVLMASFATVGPLTMSQGSVSSEMRPEAADLPDFLRLPETGTRQYVEAQQLDGLALQRLVLPDQGDTAVQMLADLASQRGGWGPAPGDIVVYDPLMAHFKRASTVGVDLPPNDCDSPDPSTSRNPDCGHDFQYQQNLVRFGQYTFVDRDRYGGVLVPREVDDMLSVYIEEVGHSWQEYCFETEGRCQGERSRLTTWGDGLMRVAGWEYQVKMYILSLDDNLLNLSQTERDELTSAICEGYANPRFAIIDASAPPDWPAPEGWPTVRPTTQEFQAFCSARA